MPPNFKTEWPISVRINLEIYFIMSDMEQRSITLKFKELKSSNGNFICAYHPAFCCTGGYKAEVLTV